MRLRRPVPGHPGPAVGEKTIGSRARPGAGTHARRGPRPPRGGGRRRLRGRSRGRRVTSVPDDAGARASIAGRLDSTLVVVAGAGTGKTTALVGRIVELVRSGRAPLREIAAITFTEAAAAELRQRIRTRLDEVAA